MATYRLGVLVVVLMGVCGAGFGQLRLGGANARVEQNEGRVLIRKAD